MASLIERALVSIAELRASLSEDENEDTREVHCPCGQPVQVMRGRHTQTWWVWHPCGYGLDPCRFGNRNFPKMPTRSEAVKVFESESK